MLGYKLHPNKTTFLGISQGASTEKIPDEGQTTIKSKLDFTDEETDGPPVSTTYFNDTILVGDPSRNSDYKISKELIMRPRLLQENFSPKLPIIRRKISNAQRSVEI